MLNSKHINMEFRLSPTREGGNGEFQLILFEQLTNVTLRWEREYKN